MSPSLTTHSPTLSLLRSPHSLTVVRTRDLKRDIGIMSETFQKKVDCKDALIRSLAKDIEEAEEQYRVALRRHLVKLDEMVGFQQKRIQNLQAEYREELDMLRAEFDRER